MKGAELILNRVWLKNYPKGVKHDVEIPNKAVFELFDEAAERYANRPAAIFLEEKITYGKLREYVDRMAAALSSLGVGKGDRVAILLPNSIQFIIAYYGTLKTGATVTPMNPLYTPREVEYQARETQAKVIFTLDILYKNVHPILNNTQIRHVIISNIADFLPGLKRSLGKLLKKIPTAEVPRDERIKSFMELLKTSRPEAPKPALDPEKDLVSLQFTGGTTGTPKGVMLTHRNVVANITQIHEMLSTYIRDGEEIFVALLPFYHIYGQTVLLGSGLTHGNALLIFPRLELEPFMKAIARHRATIFPGVPTLFNAMSKHPLIKELDLSALKLVISGADSLPVEVAKEFERVTGKKVCEGYGLTETSPVTHVNPPEAIRYGSFGVPIPNTYAAVIDPESMEFLPVGEVGELVVAGPQVMKGYMREEDNSNVFLEAHGMRWFRTGDMVRMDEDGYFHFVDRRKDIIKFKGFSVFPAEIEDVLYSNPAVKEAAVVGVPDPRTGEQIIAVVVLKDEFKGKTGEEEILKYCRERLAEYKQPSRVIFVDEIPKTAVGKILRRAVRDRVREMLVQPS